MAAGKDRIGMERCLLSTAAFRHIYYAMMRRLRCAGSRGSTKTWPSIANVAAAPRAAGPKGST